MDDNNILMKNEIEVANTLYKKNYLLKGNCLCGKNNYSIQVDNSNKTSLCCFRCGNYHCRKKYPVRINSFYAKFSKITLRIVSEVISCFLCKEFNVEKAKNLIDSEFGYNLSKRVISRIYKDIRNIIYKYMKFVYAQEFISKENVGENFSIDESLIGHVNNKQLWLIGIINNNTKEIRVEASFTRNSYTIKSFITSYIY